MKRSKYKSLTKVRICYGDAALVNGFNISVKFDGVMCYMCCGIIKVFFDETFYGNDLMTVCFY